MMERKRMMPIRAMMMTTTPKGLGDEDLEGGQNVVDLEANEAEEHKKSPSRSNEDGSGGDAREGSNSEVDSLAQSQRTENGRGLLKVVHIGVPVPG